jgi:hypothetical protein
MLRKIPFVYKRASGAFPDAARCPLYEQGREANEFLCGNCRIRIRARLTGFPSARKIVRIRTKCSSRRKAAMIGASQRAGLFMTIDAVTEGGDKIRCDACPVMC